MKKSENFEILFLNVRHFINFLPIRLILIQTIATYSLTIFLIYLFQMHSSTKSSTQPRHFFEALTSISCFAKKIFKKLKKISFIFLKSAKI